MTVLHSGTTKKYSTNWEQVFGKKKTGGAAAKPGTADKRSAAGSTMGARPAAAGKSEMPTKAVKKVATKKAAKSRRS